ncbi:MAG: acyl-CoA dehydrogenase C-terminal domain-containing protein [Spongiibacter sp.]|uniref:acyl-CoA dehydrogenase C-terminal domain-containing protein n=2 Tax=Spongiibacteraceae TaxID=1706375 RepID=UPI001B0B2585|nr:MULTISPECIES: acyl-CoA dehydrogenase C-terminal domain-containing protein [Spongiibacter]MBO6752703.1 acyl-CoA dehydrogenase C-terminal domain-containing protein [Spongiibacter sp.]|tara:strand:- start:10723 stop:12528 length:1806 start_codon:yes stop_codon:yes gene_type:complete
MTTYKAPVRDINFVINELLDYQKHYTQVPGGEEATPDMVDAIIGEAAKFAEEVLAPLNQPGDEHGCKWEDGNVTTPPGFKEAYDLWVEGGWQGLSHPAEYGGQGLPMSMGLIKSELVGTANWSWGMYPGLSLGAMNTLLVHGDEQQKNLYLSKLCEATWTGTMCLTEPHCGSDLGQMKSRAEPQQDGSYKLNGTKIFISAGEHDMAENIVHIVLARTPGAPEGTKGISLFIVPKFLSDNEGNVTERNGVNCGNIENKMGIHGNATCVINFDDATGYMLGKENEGLAAMFTFMNTARIGTAIQGLAASELAYQNAWPYAMERYSMRALSGSKNPDKAGDAIIHHGDVRRMLLTARAFAEGGRAMIYDAAKYADLMVSAPTEEERDAYENELGFLTPILKAFLTETGLESASNAMQVFGGHGFIKEHGMEQIYRDARIATMYEGTTGIQAMDLIGRKVVLDGFKLYAGFSKKLYKFGFSSLLKSKRRRYSAKLIGYTLNLNWKTVKMLARASRNRDAVSAASYDFLMYSGYLSMAYYWAMMAEVAAEKLDSADSGDREFYQAKLETAEFYFSRLLPRAKAHAAAMDSSTDSVMGMAPERFTLR